MHFKYFDLFFNCFYLKKVHSRSFGNLNYNTDHNTNHDCTVYINTNTDSDSLCLHTRVHVDD